MNDFPIMGRVDAVRLILKERQRQDQLRDAGRFPFTCADDGLDDAQRLAVLTEEVGEVARCLCERINGNVTLEGPYQLRNELVQVAAVAMAWIEYLERTGCA